MDKFKIGVAGATERAGRELVRLLLNHPSVELAGVASSAYIGKSYSAACPQFAGLCELAIMTSQELAGRVDIIFNADHYADAQELAAFAIKSRCVVVDLSPAFRLSSEEDYKLWYGDGFNYASLHEAAVYALPELLRDSLPGKVIAACPGAVATAALLALVPLLAEGLILPEGIIIDAKLPAVDCAGALGAAAGDTGEDGISAYQTAMHRETPEIEQLLSMAAGKPVCVTLSCGAMPVSRGVFISCYARPALAASDKTLHGTLERYYAGERFVRVRADASAVSTKSVEGSNLCELGACCSLRSGVAIVNAALDGLLKGSAGQAVQAMNAMLSMPEELGLSIYPRL